MKLDARAPRHKKTEWRKSGKNSVSQRWCLPAQNPLAQTVAVLSMSLFIAGSALAQGNLIPSSALPEQVSRGLKEQAPRAVEEVPPVVTPPKQAPQPGMEAAKKITFVLNGIIIKGNHVYSDAQLRKLYHDKLGKKISVAQLFEIVQGITNYYRNNGYILSRAILPPQHVKNGIVIIQVIEGFIEKVDISGHPQGARCYIQMLGYRIIQCRPLEISRMEHYLLIANETPATSVKAVLAPSKTTAGAADLTLVTENQLVTGYLSYDNYGTRYIGPQQITANLGFNSAIASGDATQITYTKTPKGTELTYTDVNYNLPIGCEGVRWLVGYTRTHTHPLFVLTPAQIDGLNLNYYTSLQFPVIRKRTESLNWFINFNYLDSIVNTIFGLLLYADHVRTLGVGVSYNFSDKYYGANSIYADLRQGLPIFGYTSNTNPQTALTSRPGGRADFTKIDIVLSRLQAIQGPYTLYGVFKGQWAFNPLLASEQFAFGGSVLGRGYDVAEIIGDRGVAGCLELRYDVGVGNRVINALQPYIFYDYGKIWNYKKIVGTPTIISGTTAGIGMRFFAYRYISGNVMWTQTLTKQVLAESLIGDGKRPRVFFSIVGSF